MEFFSLVVVGTGAACIYLSRRLRSAAPPQLKPQQKPEPAKLPVLQVPPPKIETFSAQFYDCCSIDEKCECEFGFKRPNFKSEQFTGFDGAKVKKQIFIFCGLKSTEWPSEAGDYAFVSKLKNVARSAKAKVNIVDDEPSQPGTFDVLVLPDNAKFKALTEDEMESVLSGYFQSGILTNKGSIEKGTFVFVCCHHKRDKRCSVCGPRLFKQFVELLPQYKRQIEGAQVGPVSVHRVSHVGGHKYAGNVIIYRSTQTAQTGFGDWYGFVSEEDVKRLIETSVIGGDIVHDLYRGRTGVSAKVASRVVMKENGSSIRPPEDDDS